MNQPIYSGLTYTGSVCVLLVYVVDDISSFDVELSSESKEFKLFCISTSILLMDLLAHMVFFGPIKLFKEKWSMICETLL